jgi:hypothetical protein
MLQIRSTREMPTPHGPVAPALLDSDLGPDAWHDMPELPPGSMRRQRLVQRSGSDIWAMFRDTYAVLDGPPTILHEYSVTATATATVSGGGEHGDHGGGGGEHGDHGGGGGGGDHGEHSEDVVTSCVATPHVLPWGECPNAAASARRLVGRRLGDLRAMVKEELGGTSTCTHLNDLLSSLSQAGVLVEPMVGFAGE